MKYRASFGRALYGLYLSEANSSQNIYVPFTLRWRFENGGFTLKMYQMFFVHTTLEEFKKATINNHSAFVFEENTFRRVKRLALCHRFSKSPIFLSTGKRKAGVFKLLRLKSIFEKLCFRDSSVRTVGLIKPRFKIFSASVWMLSSGETQKVRYVFTLSKFGYNFANTFLVMVICQAVQLCGGREECRSCFWKI